MRIALFKNTEFGFDSIGGKYLEAGSNYVRTSEYVEVEFPPRMADEVVQDQVKALDAERQLVIAKYVKTLANIDERKARLLALTHD